MHQVGDQTKVLLRCTVNQSSRFDKQVYNYNVHVLISMFQTLFFANINKLPSSTHILPSLVSYSFILHALLFRTQPLSSPPICFSSYFRITLLRQPNTPLPDHIYYKRCPMHAFKSSNLLPIHYSRPLFQTR